MSPSLGRAATAKGKVPTFHSCGTTWVYQPHPRMEVNLGIVYLCYQLFWECYQFWGDKGSGIWAGSYWFGSGTGSVWAVGVKGHFGASYKLTR